MGRTRMARTDGLTDGLTDGQGGDYMLPRNFSGSIKTQCTYAFGLQQACFYSISISVAVDFTPGWPKRERHMHITNATKPEG